MKLFRFLRKSKRILSIMAMGSLTLVATVATCVSTMAWYAHLNTPLTGVVESDTTDLTIESVSGYKNMLVTDNNGFVIDGGVVPISGSGSGSGGNIDQGTEDTSFDVPTEGTGYYLVRQVNGAFRYANSTKFSEYENTNRAVIAEMSNLPAGALFQVRKYDFEVVSGETKTVSTPLVFASNSSLFGATLSDGNISLTSAGTYKVWLDTENVTLGFESISSIEVVSDDVRQAISTRPRYAHCSNVKVYGNQTGSTESSSVLLSLTYDGSTYWEGTVYLQAGAWFKVVRNDSDWVGYDSALSSGNDYFNSVNDNENIEVASGQSGYYHFKIHDWNITNYGDKRWIWINGDCHITKWFGGGENVYLKTTSWKADGVRIAAYICNGTSDEWVLPSDIGNDYNKYTLPANGSWANIIFVRGAENSNPGWGAYFNKTNDLAYPSSTSNLLFTSSGYTGEWVDGKEKIGGSWGSIPSFTVSIGASPAGYGTVSPTSVASVPLGTVLSNNGTSLDVNGTTVTATPASQTDEWTYSLDSWTNGTVSVSGATSVTAVFSRAKRTYTITGATNNALWGTVSGGGEAEYGSSVTLTPNAAAHYHFVKWQDNNTDNPRRVTVSGNATYTATFAIDSFTVSFNLKGHGASIASQTVDYGGKPSQPSDPTATGYTFGGWYKENACTNAWNFSTDTVTAATVLYAKWEARSFAIAYDANGGSGTTMADTDAAYDDGVTLRTNSYSYSGHLFLGWSLSDSAESASYDDGAELDESDVNALFGEASGTPLTVTLYAVWQEIPTYTINFTVSNVGYGTVSQSSAAIPENSTYSVVNGALVFVYGNNTVATITADPADGGAQYTYAFTGWSSTSGTVTSSSDGTTITANFTQTLNNYTVTIVSNNGNYGSVDVGSVASVPYGTVITTSGNKVTVNGTEVTATATTSTAQYTYAFSSWTNGTATVNGNLTVTANFTQTLNNYTVTIVSNNGNYGSVDVGSVASVPYGTVITTSGNKVTVNGTEVTATATTSTAQYTYAFSSWTNGTATVNGNLTVTANFTRTLNSYTITFLDGNGTSIQSSSWDYGTTPSYSGNTPTKTSTAQYFYTWDEGWTPTIASVTGTATYTATFNSSVRSYTITWANIDGAGGSTTSTVAYGQTPSYNGTPTKASTLYLNYTFASWSPAIASVTGTATYTATFNSSTRYFTVTLDNGAGVDDGSVTTVRYGEAMPEISAPTKTNYVFLGYYSASNGGGNVYYNYNGTSARTSDIEVDDYTLYAYWGSATGNNNDKTNYFLGGETYRLSVGTGHWTSYTQRFAIYLTNDSDPELWIDLDGSNPLYSCTIPYGKWTSLVFCRMNGSTSVNNLDNCWDSTTAQSKTSTEAYVKQYFEVNSNDEGKGVCGGSWFSLITGGKTLYFHDTNSWGSAVMYYWTAAQAGGTGTNVTMKSLQNGYYSADLPSGEYKGIIFRQTTDNWNNKTGDINALSANANEVLYEGSGWTSLPTVFTGNTTVYMNTGGVWSGQKYAIFVYGDTNLNGQWVIMTQAATSSSYWYATIPTGNWFRILFCKINSSVVTPAWDNNVLEQTSDLIFASANPCMTITSGGGATARGANSGHGPFIGATGNQILLGFDTGLTEWKADGIKTVLKLTDGSTTEYIKMTPLEDQNGDPVCYLVVLDASLNGKWWFTFQFLRVNKNVADSDFATTDPSNIYNTVTAAFPNNYPTNKCYYIKATNFSTGDWGQKTVKANGFYIVGETSGSDSSHPLVSGHGDGWDLDNATLIATSDETNDAIWSGILLPGDVFKVVQVTNYTPDWHGYRSNPASTSSCSIFFNSSAASYTFKGDITLASSSTITAYHVTIYYPKNSAGVYISFESFDTTVAGNVKYSTVSDSKEGTAATSATIALNVPLNGDTTIDSGIAPISPATLDSITYYDFYRYSLTDATATYTGITSAVGQTISSVSPTIYATYEHQTVDFVIIGSDGTNSLGQLLSEKKDKAASGGPASYDLGSSLKSVIDNANHEVRAYSKDANDMTLHNEVGCSTSYNGALTSNVTVYLKVSQLTQKRFYIDFGSTDDSDWTYKDYVLLHVKDTNGTFITSMESGEEGLLKTGKAANYLGYVSLPTGFEFQVYATSNNGFQDHASQTPEYGATIAMGLQDFLLVKNTCDGGGYRQYLWCSLVDHSAMGTATIYKNGAAGPNMATANITNNYFLYENGLIAHTGDTFYVTVTGSTSPYVSLAGTYDGMSYIGAIPWFLDDSIPLTITLSEGLNWEHVYVYAWDSSNLSNINAAFPGEEATADSGDYLYMLSSAFDRIIISNGDGDQTVDITAAHNVHEYTVLTTKDGSNHRNCTPGEATAQALKVTADVRLNFYIANVSGTPKLAIAAVPYLGNGFYIMPSYEGNNVGFENAVKMLTITETSASYASFHAGASSSYYIRSYMSAYDHLYKDYDLTNIAGKATYNPSTGIVTFGDSGAGVYTITLSNDTVTITESSDSENFRLNGLDVSAGSASIKDQKTTLILEVCISVKNAKNMNITAALTNTFGGHVGAYLYLNHTELISPWELLRNSTNYQLLSSSSTLTNQNSLCPTIAGHSGTDYYYVYIVIDYLDKTMTPADIGGSIGVTLNAVQAS